MSDVPTSPPSLKKRAEEGRNEPPMSYIIKVAKGDWSIGSSDSLDCMADRCVIVYCLASSCVTKFNVLRVSSG